MPHLCKSGLLASMGDNASTSTRAAISHSVAALLLAASLVVPLVPDHATAEDTAAQSKTTDGKMLSLTRLVPTLTPVSDYTGELWERSTLIGDPGGLRQKLYEEGVTFDVTFTQVFQGVASGGKNKGATGYNGLIDYGFTFDTGKLGLWPGGLFVFNAQGSLGSKAFLSKAGTISPVNFNSIYPIGRYNTAVLMEYYLMQGLPWNLSLIVGRVNATNFLDNNRFANNPKNQFLNAALNNDLLFGGFLTFSMYGALLSWQATKNLIIAFAVYDPTVAPPHYGARNGLFSKVGVASQIEYSWEFGDKLGGTVRPVFLWTSKEAGALDNPFLVPGIITGSVPQKPDNWIIHLNFEQYLWKPDISPNASSQVRTASFDFQEPGLGLFFRFGYTPEDRNPWNIYVGGGIGGRGVVPGRPYDRFGLGVYTMIESGDLDKQPGNLLGDEVGVEAFYNFAITPWLQLTADFQWVSSGQTAVGDTFIPGFRVMTRF